MSLSIPKDDYDNIYGVCNQLILENKVLGAKVAAQFPHIPFNTIQFIYRQCYHRLESEQVAIIKKSISKFVEQYEGGQSVGSIVKKNGLYLPCLIREMLKYKFGVDDGSAEVMINNPSTISDSRYVSLVHSCNWTSVLEVVNHDKIRQALGLEYEYILKEQLRNRDIPFKTEAQVRSEGMLRTPDITLSYPIFIRVNEYPNNFKIWKFLNFRSWKEINWIESKALFGDEYWQKQNSQQLYSYVNRLGPGCVIYWFGFDSNVIYDESVTLLSSFPKEVYTMNDVISLSLFNKHKHKYTTSSHTFA